MAVVYQHVRKDTKEVFYIGIGSSVRRAYAKYGRTKYWKNIVNLAEYEVQILYNNISLQQAYVIEKDLIAKIGRAV